MFDKINAKGVQLKEANIRNTEAPFLDLNLLVSIDVISLKLMTNAVILIFLFFCMATSSCISDDVYSFFSLIVSQEHLIKSMNLVNRMNF